MAKLQPNNTDNSQAAPARASEGIVGAEVSFGTSRPTDERVLPRMSRSPAFFLQAHPNRFTIMSRSDGELRLVPMLSSMMIDGGVGNVNEIRGRPDVTLALARRQAKGWVVLPHDVDGPGTSYLRRVEVEKGGYHYMTRFETAYPGEEATELDSDAWLDWIAALQARGALPKPSRMTIERTRDGLRQQARNLAERPKTPAIAEQLAQMASSLAYLQSLLSGDRRAAPIPAEAAPVELAAPAAEPKKAPKKAPPPPAEGAPDA